MTKDVEDLISRLRAHDTEYTAVEKEALGLLAHNCLTDHVLTAAHAKVILNIMARFEKTSREAASALSSLSLRVEELGRLPTEMQLLDAFSIHELEPSIVIKVRGIIRDVFRSARLRTAAVDNGSVRGREGE